MELATHKARKLSSFSTIISRPGRRAAAGFDALTKAAQKLVLGSFILGRAAAAWSKTVDDALVQLSPPILPLTRQYRRLLYADFHRRSVLAYDSLHPELKDRFVVSRANSGEFGVRLFKYDETQTSTMFAGTHARGGSNFFVWISEWGVIQAEDLRRSEEIPTGAIPSAKDGLVVVETTWRCGRGGHLWEIVKKALETPEERKHPDDWRVVFFPWQEDPT